MSFFDEEDLLVLVFFISELLLVDVFDDVDDFLASSIASAIASTTSDFFDEDDFDVLVFFFSDDLLVDMSLMNCSYSLPLQQHLQ